MKVRIVGSDENSEILEADLAVAHVPRAGETISIWSNFHLHQGTEIHLQVEGVIHEAYGETPITKISVHRGEGLSDEEWRNVFRAINEEHTP